MLYAEFQDHWNFFFFFEKRILKVFALYGHGGHLDHVTKTMFISLCPLFPTRLNIKFGFDWPSG